MCGGGIGLTKKNPRIIGREVPKASMSRNSEVFPGKSVCAMVEKRKADRPKPEITIPFAVARYGHGRVVNSMSLRKPKALTVRSGQLFAVEFIALARPPFPPIPVQKLKTARRMMLNVVRLEAPSASP